ncbi:Kv channel-interacting protein 1-like isoform X1 [Tigriopus californicus]|uniref:Kv channel-interacting protein 1-like isoform X1 n=1 Tax=Tigriopus californicus TaxID=6832 RepID=UPI0027DAABEE|nr:Kv channel-interacting protein 1-like isoform X1 [Tigriopus californicus]
MQTLCDATGFSISEMKRIYRGFKTECPSGLITEEAFHSIYSRFFPQGAPFIWSDIRGYVHCSGEWAGKKKVSKKEQKALDLQSAQAALSSYSHYVFSTLDRNDSGVITFQDFVVGLSILIRGTLEEKLRWTFSLYDQDRDGVISREEMEDVVGSVFDLMGRTGDPISEEAIITERVDQIFQKMDLNGDGVVSIEEFLESCQNDETISRSVQAFTNVHI